MQGMPNEKQIFWQKHDLHILNSWYLMETDDA